MDAVADMLRSVHLTYLRLRFAEIRVFRERGGDDEVESQYDIRVYRKGRYHVLCWADSFVQK